MVSTTSKKTRRFDSEIANFLFTTVEYTVGIRCLEFVLLCFRLFLLCRSHRLLLGLLSLKVLKHWPKIAQFELGNLRATSLR